MGVDRMIAEDEIITINKVAYSLAEIHRKIAKINLPDWERNIYHFIDTWFNSEEFIEQKTSGSTGEPKTIQLPKSSMHKSAQNTNHFFGLSAGKTALLCLPVNFIAGKMMIVRAITGKLNLLVTEPGSKPEIPGQSIHFAAATPLQLQYLIDSKKTFDNIENLIVGGAPVSKKLENEIQNLKIKIFATYGMTETCSHVALKRINGKNPDKHYQALNGVDFSISSGSCLIINASGICQKPIETTDIVELISPTEFNWLGRADNAINSGGIKALPEELENKITAITGCECLISSKPDKLLGQKIIALFESKDKERLTDDMQKRIKFELGKYLSPKEFIFVDKFPRNNSLKIDRKSIKI